MRVHQIARHLAPASSMATQRPTPTTVSQHLAGTTDSWHSSVTKDGPFKPEKDRYHLYIGLFCPFAHRANFMLHLKQLDKYAGIETSIVKPYPKGDDKGWPGWQFNLKSEPEGCYEGSTEDK